VIVSLVSVLVLKADFKLSEFQHKLTPNETLNCEIGCGDCLLGFCFGFEWVITFREISWTARETMAKTAAAKSANAKLKAIDLP
jgi:hypothetical protein